MKTNIFTTLTIIGLAGLLAGCVTDQSNLGIDKALESLGSGLAGMKGAELNQLTNACFVSRGMTNNFISGLYMADATVVFNVTANKSTGNALTLDVSAQAPQVPAQGSVSDTYSSASSITRGNQIAIHFMSPLFTTTITTTTTNAGSSTAKADSSTTSTNSPTTTTSTTSTNKQSGQVVVTVVKIGITDPKTLAAWFGVVNANMYGDKSSAHENLQ